MKYPSCGQTRGGVELASGDAAVFGRDANDVVHDRLSTNLSQAIIIGDKSHLEGFDIRSILKVCNAEDVQMIDLGGANFAFPTDDPGAHEKNHDQ